MFQVYYRRAGIDSSAIRNDIVKQHEENKGITQKVEAKPQEAPSGGVTGGKGTVKEP